LEKADTCTKTVKNICNTNVHLLPGL
jgi:hypothetical protein